MQPNILKYILDIQSVIAEIEIIKTKAGIILVLFNLT